MTTVSRLSRVNIRPLLLPPPGASPSALKRAYDVAGTVITILCLNYICAPFMLLSIRDSLEAWRILGWYGFWIIFGGLAFFYAGGGKALKSFHPRQVKEDEKMRPKPNLRAQMPASGLTQVDGTAPVTPGSAPVTPGFVPPFDSAAKEMEKRLE
jgi:lysophospholipid acyltransferase